MAHSTEQKTSPDKRTKAEQAAEQLEAAIVSCQLAPGTVMTETELSEYLEIGRTPVREALTRLANENLVRLSRAGVVIPELNPMTMLKLLEPRALIEKLCIEKAVERITPRERAAIKPVIDTLNSLDRADRSGFMDVLRQIHHLLARASCNEFILASIKTTQGLSRRFWCYYASDDDQAYCTDLYIRQLRALEAQQLQPALDCSAELISYLQTFTRQQMEQFH